MDITSNTYLKLMVTEKADQSEVDALSLIHILEDAELMTIWRSAQGFYQRVSAQDNYVPPEQWNACLLYTSRCV